MGRVVGQAVHFSGNPVATTIVSFSGIAIIGAWRLLSAGLGF